MASDLVKNEALLEALKSGQIAAAGLDVLAPEPVKEDNIVVKAMKNDGELAEKIVLAPHIAGLTEEQVKNTIIAYEPIWAIGTNETPTTNEIDIYIRYIKQIVKKHFNFKNIKVVYGGSVNEKNIDEIAKIKSIDGVLVGGASTKYKEFIKIVTTVLEEDKKLQNSTN